MRKILLLVSVLVLSTSCKDEQKTKVDAKGDNESIQIKSNSENSSQPITNTRNDGNNDSTTAPSKQIAVADISSGTYIKTDSEKSDCDCNCLEIDLSKNTELCLSKDGIYVDTRVEKTNEGEMRFYFEAPSSKNTNKDLPWDKFDKDQPIAILSFDNNGALSLDWKGFNINGELAVDYALYGKKTLEGSYKKL